MGKKLFCITYAGGTKSFFDGLIRHMPETIDVIPLEYSGHGGRYAEGFYADFQELTEDLAARINDRIEERDEVCLFGYSMGSYGAYEVARQKLLHRPVRHLFTAAHVGPDHNGALFHGFGELSDEALIDAISEMGGLDERILKNPRFLKIYLEIIRNDYRILDTHRFDEEHCRVDCPVTMFYSETDTPAIMRSGWARVTDRVEYIRYEGTHFFLKQHEEEIAREIAGRMEHENR